MFHLRVKQERRRGSEATYAPDCPLGHVEETVLASSFRSGTRVGARLMKRAWQARGGAEWVGDEVRIAAYNVPAIPSTPVKNSIAC